MLSFSFREELLNFPENKMKYCMACSNWGYTWLLAAKWLLRRRQGFYLLSHPSSPWSRLLNGACCFLVLPDEGRHGSYIFTLRNSFRGWRVAQEIRASAVLPEDQVPSIHMEVHNHPVTMAPEDQVPCSELSRYQAHTVHRHMHR